MFDANDESTAEEIRRGTMRLAATGGPATQADRITMLRRLEELTSAAAGLQAQVAADLDRCGRSEAACAGVPADRRGRGIAAQVAPARRESPHRGRVRLGVAQVLTSEMPCTFTALRTGRISEWRATLMVRETAAVSRAVRERIDAVLAGDPERIAGMSDGEIVAAVRELAYAAEPRIWVERHAKAVGDRTVTMRPAPDGMVYLTALLPLVEGVATYKSLLAATSDHTAAGGRGRGQIMADTLVERITSADGAGRLPSIPVTVDLVVSDRTLPGADSTTIDSPTEGAGDEAAYVDGYGPIPAEVARLVVDRAARAGSAGLRRLDAGPATGELVAMDRRTRLFPDDLATVIRLRDRRCRTPWCDAPIRRTDHVRPYADGGSTDYANGQGLCQACNHAKQAPGWHQDSSTEGGRHVTRTVTPTGHHYRSAAPPLPRPAA
ncbi:HNH endonuclease [Millisia brevis]|uniref:HNH endonuclease n=1 Tax=Millisia brevis TaxID=264148 RepID=UPI000836BEF1|nr:HNH endonuclease signature motif containing protein [Millisia brevis]